MSYREYDISKPEDPAQTFTFLPAGSTSSRFSALDPLSLHATSFAFSHGTADFGPLGVYVMMANGDLYTMSPVLPLHAEVPVNYLQGLASHAKESGGQAEKRWVDSLVRQVKASEDLIKQREEEIEQMLSTPMRDGGLKAGSEIPAREIPTARNGMVRLHPPHLTETGGPAVGQHRDLARQGPFTFSPGPPADDDGEDEPVTCDLMVSAVPVGEGESERVNVVAMTWSHGRLDVGLEQDAIRPQWMTNKVSPLYLAFRLLMVNPGLTGHNTRHSCNRIGLPVYAR
jgi:nucleoporin NUP82